MKICLYLFNKPSTILPILMLKSKYRMFVYLFVRNKTIQGDILVKMCNMTFFICKFSVFINFQY